MPEKRARLVSHNLYELMIVTLIFVFNLSSNRIYGMYGYSCCEVVKMRKSFKSTSAYLFQLLDSTTIRVEFVSINLILLGRQYSIVVFVFEFIFNRQISSQQFDSHINRKLKCTSQRCHSMSIRHCRRASALSEEFLQL